MAPAGIRLRVVLFVCHFVRKSLELLQNAVLFLNLVDHFTLILKLFASRRQKQYPLHLDYIVILGLKG